jgi:hypothetical protein
MTTGAGHWLWASGTGWIEWLSHYGGVSNVASATGGRAAKNYPYNTRYVDPDTGSWALDDYHNFQRIDAPLGWVFTHLMTERGSIPELPWFGSNLRKLKHLSVGVTSQIENAIDEALRPFVGQKFDTYSRKAWMQNGAPLFSVTITVGGAAATLQIPLE